MSQDCIFCKIANKQVQSRIEYEDDELVAFHDINPQAPTHVLIVPKKHVPTLNESAAEDAPMLGKMLLLARDLAQKLGVAHSGYRLVLNTNRDSGQAVFHVHLHLLGGRRFVWPPG